MNFKCPLIVVADMAVSRTFYEDVLRQKVILDFGANITFAGDFALQTKDSWRDFIKKSEILNKPNNFELYFEEEAFDKFMTHLKNFSIDYLHDVVEYPWGQRVTRFYDPDGHIIEVGESMTTVVKRFLSQGMTVAETAEKTQHPIEFVRKCLSF
ncbi:glyoxalase/bleomycin resistance/dioxygenase family protein [Eubacteriaceae bacterium ES3]|nr:glyoxalase/bleomycin resistance/dioxygenase family protein [Eubacteriaceae bacterium ES3]